MRRGGGVEGDHIREEEMGQKRDIASGVFAITDERPL
jgi:hypothetical protein